MSVFLIGILSLFSTEIRAQLPDSVRKQALRDFHGADLKGKDGPLKKAGLDLLLLYHAYRTQKQDGGDRPLESIDPGFKIQNGHVTIDAIAAENPATLQADLKALGMRKAASAGQMVSGLFPIAKIPEMATLPSLRGVQISRYQTQPSDQSDLASRSTTQLSPSPKPKNEGSASSAAPTDTSRKGPPQANTETGTQEEPRAPSSDDANQPSSPTDAELGFHWGLVLGVVGLLLAGLLAFLWRS